MAQYYRLILISSSNYNTLDLTYSRGTQHCNNYFFPFPCLHTGSYVLRKDIKLRNQHFLYQLFPSSHSGPYKLRRDMQWRK